MTDLLGQIPLAVMETSIDDRASTMTVTLGDYEAIAEMAGSPQPQTSDTKVLVRWLADLSVGAPIEDGGTGFAFVASDFPEQRALAVPDEIVAEFGFSPFDIETFATFRATPVEFAALTGDLELSPDLADLGDGISSAGTGEDFEMALDEQTRARPLGTPRRFAARDGVIASSTARSLVEAWLVDGGATLAEVPEFSALAAGLDRQGVVNALITVGDFAAQAGSVGDTRGIGVPFEGVAIGVASTDGAPTSVVVYSFADDAAAALAVADVTRVWTEGEISNKSMAEMYPEVTVEQFGTTVIVRAPISEEITTQVAVSFLYRVERPFTFETGN